MTENKNINLENINGGSGEGARWRLAVPKVQEGFLALRSAPAWQQSNEIAQIWPGNQFYVDPTITASTDYLFYWASFNGKTGWVNSNYLTIIG